MLKNLAQGPFLLIAAIGTGFIFLGLLGIDLIDSIGRKSDESDPSR